MGRGQDILARVQSWEERLCCLCYVHFCLCWRLSRSVFVFVFMFILRLICELLHASINNVCIIDICSLTVDGVGDGVGADGVLGDGGGGNYVNVKIHKGW